MLANTAQAAANLMSTGSGFRSCATGVSVMPRDYRQAQLALSGRATEGKSVQGPLSGFQVKNRKWPVRPQEGPPTVR